MLFSEERVRKQIEKIYGENPLIHIHITQTRPKISLHNEQVKIVGVYRHIFCVEEYTKGKPTTHSVRYADVISGQVQIVELPL